MTFKDTVRGDIEDIFLNPAEFGEEHTVNGKSGVSIVFDDFELLNREKFRNDVRDDGTSLKRSVFYVKASDFGRLPMTGSQVTIDGKRFRVEKAVNEQGVYSVTVCGVR